MSEDPYRDRYPPASSLRAMVILIAFAGVFVAPGEWLHALRDHAPEPKFSTPGELWTFNVCSFLGYGLPPLLLGNAMVCLPILHSRRRADWRRLQALVGILYGVLYIPITLLGDERIHLARVAGGGFVATLAAHGLLTWLSDSYRCPKAPRAERTTAGLPADGPIATEEGAR